MSTSLETVHEEIPDMNHRGAKNFLARREREARAERIAQSRERSHHKALDANAADTSLQIDATRAEFKVRLERALDGGATPIDRAFIVDMLPLFEEPYGDSGATVVYLSESIA